MCQKLYSGNKIIGDLKNCKIRIFVRIFGANKGRLRGFRGALRVPNFVLASLCARNCIPAKKLLAVSKMAKLEFLFVFLEQIRVDWGWSAVLCGFPQFSSS